MFSRKTKDYSSFKRRSVTNFVMAFIIISIVFISTLKIVNIMILPVPKDFNPIELVFIFMVLLVPITLVTFEKNNSNTEIICSGLVKSCINIFSLVYIILLYNQLTN